jgi:uncharacterized membrane protein
MKMKIVFACLVIIVFAACSKSNPASHNNNNNSTVDCSAVPKSFSANVQPITSTRCAISGCHDAGSNNGPGPLTTYQQIFNARSLIRPAVASGLMPQGSTLTQGQINTILCWIDNGAPNN